MKQSMKLGARILENLPEMPPHVMQTWIDNPKALRKFLAGLVPADEKQSAASVGSDTSHLRYLDGAMLAATAGSTTLAQANDVFTGFLDSDFKSWGTDLAGADTEETSVGIYEMKKNGTFADIFSSFGVDARLLCLSQGQVKEFARSHRHMLRQDGYATLFLFEVNGEIFVALMRVDSGRLEASVNRFSRSRVWRAGNRYRVVVPQQTV